jgi:hypothetical protein
VAWTLTIEAVRLKMYRGRSVLCSPVVADLHHFEQELDPDPHQSEKRFRIRKSDQSHLCFNTAHSLEKLVSNCIKVVRIRNTDKQCCGS